MPFTCLSDPALYTEKESLYLSIRKKEGRVLSDAQLQLLPDKSPDPALQQEWKWRKRSFKRLTRRIEVLEKAGPSRLFSILDLGCGNGWMAAALAAGHPNRSVWAADLNREELEQGSRVFRGNNLYFVFGDILQQVFPRENFDLVVMGASVQYFPDLKALLTEIGKVLRPGGYLEILDSPFYPTPVAQAAARARSATYFSKLGFPEMARYYHHHLMGDIKGLGACNLNGNLPVKIGQKMHYYAPFPWMEWQKPRLK